MLGTLDLTGSGHWAPSDYSQSTALAVCTCTHCTFAFMRNNYLKNTYKRTHKKTKNKKTRKQHVHQQKNLTTALAKNENVIELSLQLAGQFQRTFKRRVSYIQDNVRVWMGLTDN